MQLHNTTKYAIRILCYIADNGDEKLYSAKELSEILGIPYKFLTKIMIELVNAKFVNSIKGREGGYELIADPSKTSIKDILETFKDLEEDTTCILGIGHCDCNNKCALHDKWVEPRALIRKMYENTTLEDIKDKDFKL
ncbi:RrF2 family transcriptional regulator [Halarcobacter sp.]|uniref:RrF2 family transcriptional regulator n=1 Tax=Halarcobacter sp. TaxID=2321133 RepID=UPI003AFF6D3C